MSSFNSSSTPTNFNSSPVKDKDYERKIKQLRSLLMNSLQDENLPACDHEDDDSQFLYKSYSMGLSLSLIVLTLRITKIKDLILDSLS